MFLHVLHNRKVANSWLLFVPGVCRKRGEKVRNSRSGNDRPAKFQVGKFFLSALGFFCSFIDLCWGQIEKLDGNKVCLTKHNKLRIVSNAILIFVPYNRKWRKKRDHSRFFDSLVENSDVEKLLCQNILSLGSNLSSQKHNLIFCDTL